MSWVGDRLGGTSARFAAATRWLRILLAPVIVCALAHPDAAERVALEGKQTDHQVAGTKPAVEKAHEVLRNYRTAAGGTQRLAGVRTLIAEGTVWRRLPIEHESNYLFRYSYPASFQFVQLVPPSFVLGPLVFTAHAGVTWKRGEAKIVSAGSAIPDDAQIRRRILEMPLGMLPSAVADSGLVTFTYGGTRIEQGVEVVDLEVADAGGSFGRIAFSKGRGLPLSYTFRTKGIGGEVSTRFDFSDHRTVEGVLLPFTVTREDGRYRVRISRYVVNQELSPSLFKEPADERDLARIIEAARIR